MEVPQYNDTEIGSVFDNSALDTKFNGTANFGAVFNSLVTSVSNNRPSKPEPYVPINMRND